MALPGHQLQVLTVVQWWLLAVCMPRAAVLEAFPRKVLLLGQPLLAAYFLEAGQWGGCGLAVDLDLHPQEVAADEHLATEANRLNREWSRNELMQ